MSKLGFDFANEVAEKAQKKQAKYEYFKVEAKPKRIRFLTLDGNESVLTYAKHFVTFKNGWFRSYSCPDFDESGKSTCVICKAKKGPSEDIVQDNYGTKFMMQVIERGDTEDKIKVFECSPFLWTTLVAYHKEHGDLGDRDYEISMTKVKDKGKEKTQYIVTACSKKAIPLSDEDDTLAETRAKLTDIEPKYDEQEILRLCAMEKGDSAATKEKVKENLSEFLGKSDEEEEDDDNDILKSIKDKAKTKAEPKAEEPEEEESEDEEDEDEDKEFFKTLKRHKK